MSKSNYSNDNRSSPFKKGRFSDIVTPKRPRYTRSSYKSDKDVVDTLTIDLVQVLADVGIVIKNVHTIAKGLVLLGWTKIKKLEGEG
ncbi:hypothetical protein LCGC14_2308210 [marine sediment metagenome]|uniref:Uncharacterized protein n=1 Tax=marine sediment metagenome TaxID=412755 RepID=A0A0F9D8X6_9ZZZZ